MSGLYYYFYLYWAFSGFVLWQDNWSTIYYSIDYGNRNSFLISSIEYY
jgi:hypothetical protein